MGTWGPEIYEDDLALDIRADFERLLGDGVSPTEATRRLIADYSDTVDDFDEGPTFWIALAQTQWELGRLEEDVKQRALRVLSEGGDLARWVDGYDEAAAARRSVVLNSLQLRLQTPQPSPVPVSPAKRHETRFKVGDVIAYRQSSGALVLLPVIEIHEDDGGRAPVVEILDWSGETAPDRRTIRKLLEQKPKRYTAGDPDATLIIFGEDEPDFPEDRITLAERELAREKPLSGGRISWWSSLDETLSSLPGGKWPWAQARDP